MAREVHRLASQANNVASTNEAHRLTVGLSFVVLAEMIHIPRDLRRRHRISSLVSIGEDDLCSCTEWERDLTTRWCHSRV
jgi:hypothetical protein